MTRMMRARMMRASKDANDDQLERKYDETGDEGRDETESSKDVNDDQLLKRKYDETGDEGGTESNKCKYAVFLAPSFEDKATSMGTEPVTDRSIDEVETPSFEDKATSMNTDSVTDRFIEEQACTSIEANNRYQEVNIAILDKKLKFGQKSDTPKISVATFEPKPACFFEADDAKNLMRKREILKEMGAKFVTKTVEHVTGHYTKIDIFVPLEWRNCVEFSVGMLLAIMAQKITAKVQERFMQLEGVQKMKYETNLYIETLTMEKDLFLKPKGLINFDDMGMPDIDIENNAGKMYKILLQKEDFCGLIGMVIYCVYMSCDKYDRRRHYAHSDDSEYDSDQYNNNEKECSCGICFF